MTILELVLNMLAEATTTELSKTAKPVTFLLKTCLREDAVKALQNR